MPDKATETVPKLARFPNFAPGNAYRETCRNAEPRWGVCSIFHSIAFLFGFNALHGSSFRQYAILCISCVPKVPLSPNHEHVFL